MSPLIYFLLQYLHCLVSYRDRTQVCTDVIEYLCTKQTLNCLDPEISHHLLETMLYKVHLAVQADQLLYAKNALRVNRPFMFILNVFSMGLTSSHDLFLVYHERSLFLLLFVEEASSISPGFTL